LRGGARRLFGVRWMMGRERRRSWGQERIVGTRLCPGRGYICVLVGCLVVGTDVNGLLIFG
jgi:hypothetical protein